MIIVNSRMKNGVIKAISIFIASTSTLMQSCNMNPQNMQMKEATTEINITEINLDGQPRVTANTNPKSKGNSGTACWKIGVGFGIGLITGFTATFPSTYVPLNNQKLACEAALYGLIIDQVITGNRLLQEEQSGKIYKPGCLDRELGYKDPLTGEEKVGYIALQGKNETANAIINAKGGRAALPEEPAKVFDNFIENSKKIMDAICANSTQVCNSTNK